MQPEIILPDTTRHFDLLEELDLRPELLRECGMKALAAYNQTTLHDAASAGGQYAYLAAVRSVRDGLCPIGWEPHVRHNLEMTVNPETNISILVSSGNKDTGKKNGSPKTKNPKGNQTKKIVSFNYRQLRLPTKGYKVKNISISNIWLLLYHIDIKMSQMRLELSLPVEMDLEEVHVTGWHKRIIIPHIDFDHAPIPPFTKTDQEFSDDFSIELKRKSNG